MGEGLWRFAETERPAVRPMVVFELSVAAVWRIVEGLVGAAGTCLRAEMLEKGMRAFVEGMGALVAVLGAFGMFGWERAVAADLEVRVEGLFDGIGFVAEEAAGLPAVEAFVDVGLTGLGFRSGYSSSSTFWKFASAFFFASRV